MDLIARNLKESPLYVSLNCTHYGYSLDLWKQAFKDQGLKPRVFLNPNSKMIDFLFERQRQNRFPDIETSVSVVSMVEISQEKIDSIGGWLEKISPQTAEALIRYDLRANLFEWKEYVNSDR